MVCNVHGRSGDLALYVTNFVGSIVRIQKRLFPRPPPALRLRKQILCFCQFSICAVHLCPQLGLFLVLLKLNRIHKARINTSCVLFKWRRNFPGFPNGVVGLRCLPDNFHQLLLLLLTEKLVLFVVSSDFRRESGNKLLVGWGSVFHKENTGANYAKAPSEHPDPSS